jgi:hypothetical protein
VEVKREEKKKEISSPIVGFVSRWTREFNPLLKKAKRNETKQRERKKNQAQQCTENYGKREEERSTQEEEKYMYIYNYIYVPNVRLRD